MALDTAKAMEALGKWAGKYGFRTLPTESILLEHADVTLQIKIEPGGAPGEVRLKWTSRGNPRSGDVTTSETP